MAAKSRGRGHRLVQVSVARLMMVVALVAVLCWAWLYHREHANIDRSWASIHLRDLHRDEAVYRRRAAERLDRAGADDMSRVVSGLVGAMGDPDWQVRCTAARSLADVIHWRAANSKTALVDEIDLATRALFPMFEDPRTEVRIEAMRSVGKLGSICRASPGPLGRSAATSVILPEAKQIAAALLSAMHDPAIDVRAAAVRSLAHVGPLAGIDLSPIEVAAENDPAIEVRTSALGALFTGWPEQSRNKDVLGR